MYQSAHMHTALTPVSYRCTLFATRRVEALLFRRSVGTAAVVGQPCSPASALAPAYRWHSVRRSFCDNQKRIVLRNSSDRDADLVSSLKDDLDRLKSKQANASKKFTNGANIYEAKVEPPAGIVGSLKETIDKVLIADFFFVLAALAWLAAGVGEKSTLNSTRLLDAWYPLWMLVFQPAIGVLMLGALVSGAAGWLKNRSSA